MTERMIRTTQGLIRAEDYESRQRELYGVYKTHNRWDLAKDFFMLKPKDFKQKYGFHYYPDTQIFQKAQKFVYGKNIVQVDVEDL